MAYLLSGGVSVAYTGGEIVGTVITGLSYSWLLTRITTFVSPNIYCQRVGNSMPNRLSGSEMVISSVEQRPCRYLPSVLQR